MFVQLASSRARDLQPPTARGQDRASGGHGHQPLISDDALIQQFLLDLSTRLGVFAYVIVFLGVGIESIGVPVPGELTLLVGVVLSVQGKLSVAVVAACAWVGAVGGDNLGYLVGRRWGTKLVTIRGLRRVYTADRLAEAERFFARRGWIAVFGGRFVALLRIFAGPLAGMHRMPWSHFVVANALGAATWITAIVIVGELIGANLDRAVRLVSRAGYAGLAIVVLLVAGYVGLRVWRGRRRRRGAGA